jgi:hypothetical protein
MAELNRALLMRVGQPHVRLQNVEVERADARELAFEFRATRDWTEEVVVDPRTVETLAGSKETRAVAVAGGQRLARR